jgi:transposase-like protein
VDGFDLGRPVGCRDLEELLAVRRIEVDRVTRSRWVEQFTPLQVDTAGLRRELRCGTGS